MKKTLLLMLSFFGIVLAALAQGTAKFDFTNPTGLTPMDGYKAVVPSETASKGVEIGLIPFVNNGVDLTCNKSQAKSEPVVFTKKDGASYELRVYKSNTIDFSAPTGCVITSITLTGDAIGDNVLTPSEGQYSSKAWTGSSAFLTFTATATIKINTVEVTFAKEGTPTEPTEKSTLFSETFASSLGSFTIDNKTLPEGVEYIWKYNSYKDDGYAKASAYVSGKSYATESWLVSPEIDLTKATSLSLSFDHAINKGDASKMAELHKLYVKAEGGDWTEMPIATMPEGTNWTFVSTTQDLSAYDGKKIQIAFAYTSTEESAATWEVKNVKIEGVGETVNPEPEVPHYASLADMMAAATTSKVECTLAADNLLVTGVGKRGNNYTVFVTDGTTSATLYGANEPICKKGDKLAGTLSGNVVLYNSSLELDAANYEQASVASQGNEVAPEVVTIADLNNDTKAAYQSRFVRLENVNFEKEALESSNVNLVDDSDNTIVLRDNFNVLADVVFSTEKAYNVDAYVAYYKGVAQLYVCSAEDLHILTTLKDAETSWAADTIANLPNQEATANKLNTLSDGKKTFTSSNEKVATVDAEGVVSFVGYGHTVITVETEETSAYLASKASYDLYFIEGEGTMEKPYSAVDVDYFNGKVSEKVWVKGTIIGYISDTSKGLYSPADDKTVATNLAVGTEDAYLPVQLPKGNVRSALNLVDNPDMQDRTIWLYGDIATYCGKAGLKNVTQFSVDGITGISKVENGVNASTSIYDINGRRLQQTVKGLNIINGRKVLVK